MALDDETVANALSGISVAAAALVEDLHEELVSAVPQDEAARRERMQRLVKLGDQLSKLGEARQLLIAANADG